ncbi:MAG TPA: 2Fe-2S iron-sulfur cluster-binding protein [Alphaproteobacteria bacterium]|nr:2Fe-2S iron-sulfur cluster-binding protein [Alphaproteobacteria bacterium]
MTRIALTLNGKPVEAEVEPRTSLADFLRVTQRLTGTHLGCEHGVCGACTVMIDGAPARSCIAFAIALEGKDVRTVEGFEDDPVMTKLREAFHEEHALQCGFCTSGMLMTARDIVTRLATADEKRIRAELAGNLCRCTGYMGIVNALLRVMREMPAEARLGKTSAPPAPPAAAAVKPFESFAAKPDSTAAPAATPAAAWEQPPETGWTRITDRFVLALAPQAAWQLLGDLPRLARAMPGAELTASDGANLEGRMRVAFGPMKASFAGKGAIERDAASMTGVLRGGGSDERGGSRAKGRVAYRLLPEASGEATRVELALDYQLQGPLAQFARVGLVKDFAQRLIAEFARNLEASLARKGESAEAPVAPLRAGALFWSVLWARLKRLLGLSP